jgi:hypothetical protein
MAATRDWQTPGSGKTSPSAATPLHPLSSAPPPTYPAISGGARLADPCLPEWNRGGVWLGEVQNAWGMQAKPPNAA